MPAAAAELTEEQIEEGQKFVVNNAIFILFHEAGHMLVSEFNLPVRGREEDTVDALSSVLLLGAEDEELYTTMQDSADGWFLLDEAKEDGPQDEDFMGTHGLDRQRNGRMPAEKDDRQACGACAVVSPQNSQEIEPAPARQAKVCDDDTPRIQGRIGRESCKECIGRRKISDAIAVSREENRNFLTDYLVVFDNINRSAVIHGFFSTFWRKQHIRPVWLAGRGKAWCR